MNTRQIILHLSLLKKVGPATVEAIIAAAGDQISTIYDWHASDFQKMIGGSLDRSQEIATGMADRDTLDRALALMQEHDFSYVTIADAHYPALLRQIHRPPSVLYTHGAQLQDGSANLAVIGSRKANAYGQQVIDMLIPPLVYQGWTIVSGGALGADAMAHQATLQAGGTTVVVLGSGLLNIAPRSNMRLFNQVVDQGGTIVSSFDLQEQAEPGHFPARNRIIAGLSRGCIVVQAAQQSGASITAHFALEQGREVFAVPGPITDELSLGCHALLREGATAVSSVQDITLAFGDSIPMPMHPDVSEANNNIPTKDGQSLEESVLFLCATPSTLDDLLTASGIQAGALQALLCDLQMSGRVEQNFAGQWVRKRY